MTLAAKAAALRRLHQPGRPVLFANIWDPVSARWLEQAGWPAVATSSAAIANAHGYPDGERIPRAEMLAAVARIAGAVEVPVSADMEAGYGATPEAWAATAAALLAAGAVGCNLEDAAAPAPGGSPLVAVELQCALLRAVRQTA
ncbi:MAG: isocitrate lyase/phosphoenolpyruvate mutase family protein, partial [Terriglobales bacterium]